MHHIELICCYILPLYCLFYGKDMYFIKIQLQMSKPTNAVPFLGLFLKSPFFLCAEFFFNLSPLMYFNIVFRMYYLQMCDYRFPFF